MRGLTKPAASGFTLFELMVGIAIAGILVGLAVPSFQEYGRSTRVIATQNDLVTALNYGRSEAIRRAALVTVCPSSSATTCADASAWPNGWFAFLDADGDGTRQNGEEILRLWHGPGDASVAITGTGTGASAAWATFTATGLVRPTAATRSYLVYSTSCRSGEPGARQIQLNGLGSIRHDRIDCP
ncbi:MAG: GspH/FimT family pseudopilin [Gammaproteobacteria bacterium]|jgi:type IV fimbrial biogenesis protein FimT|nr:GspH/FimT family pseudopilin [Gammaproteobacteria bacterium]